MRRTALAALALLLLAAPLSAQQPPVRPSVGAAAAQDTLTPTQRALRMLRERPGVGQPDTAEVPVDTVRAQQVRVRGGAAQTAAPSGIERDSIMELLAALGGYIATEYTAEQARFNADSSRLELRRNPQVAREGNQLVADSLIMYDEILAVACGYGSPVLHATSMQAPLASDTVCFNVRRQTGYARGARTTFAEGASWIISGDVYVHGNDFYSHRAIFTDCDEEHPHYHFGAKDVKVVRDNVLVARDVTLNFGDVPVFWLPFMVQSLSQGRRSGILMPRFGINDIARTNARYSRRIEDIGVYWAVNEYMGAELAMDWFANNWTSLRGSMDYNFASRFLRGGMTYKHFWKQEGGREFTLTSRNTWQADERTNVSVNANYVSATQFVQQRTFDPRELNRSIDSQVGVNRRFDWGSLSANASRRQQVSTDLTTWQLPSLGLTISPITLFETLPGDDRWYSNANWSGGTNLRADRWDVGPANTDVRTQSRRQLNASANSSFNIGNFGVSQQVSFDEQERLERVFPGDSLPPLPSALEQSGRWSSSLSYMQQLIGSTTLSPGITVGSEFRRSERTGDELLHAPMRVDFSTSIRTDLYGFFPGVGPFERLRHKISPSITYGYSPEARADSVQRAVFTSDGVREQNRINLQFAQTIEARYRGGVVEAPRDTAGQDTVQGPRRRERARTVTLLSISTNALIYDFVRARDDYGFMTTELNNNIRSDLIQGLTLGIDHSLFRTPEGSLPSEGVREFRPQLRRVNASFSLDSNSWLFRLLRIGARNTDPDQSGAPVQEGDPYGAGPAIERTESEYGMVGTSRRGMGEQAGGPVGSWSSHLTYTHSRNRDPFGNPFPGDRGDNQMLTGTMRFQPTVNWGVNWQTGYSFTSGEFTDHVLTLTRTLHDWDANFDFVKAQNGNFSFQFRVHLRANPDIKVDYSQSDARALNRPGEQIR